MKIQALGYFCLQSRWSKCLYKQLENGTKYMRKWFSGFGYQAKECDPWEKEDPGDEPHNQPQPQLSAWNNFLAENKELEPTQKMTTALRWEVEIRDCWRHWDLQGTVLERLSINKLSILPKSINSIQLQSKSQEASFYSLEIDKLVLNLM